CPSVISPGRRRPGHPERTGFLRRSTTCRAWKISRCRRPSARQSTAARSSPEPSGSRVSCPLVFDPVPSLHAETCQRTDPLTGDVTVKNLTVQPWATTDGTTASPTGVRVFFVTLPDQGVTINNADGTGTFTASNQPYYEYSAAALGADGILSSNEVSSIKTW